MAFMSVALLGSLSGAAFLFMLPSVDCDSGLRLLFSPGVWYGEPLLLVLNVLLLVFGLLSGVVDASQDWLFLL